MKKIFLILATITLLASCETIDDKSDAYGNFEVMEVIISSEANGKILLLNFEEGQLLKPNIIIGHIDSTELLLKREQLDQSIRAMSSRIKNLDSQIDVQNQISANVLIDKDRIEKLLEESAATQKQLDDVNGNLKVIEKQIASIESQKSSIRNEILAVRKQQEQLSDRIAKCKIINTMEGTVLTKFAEAGEITSFGKPLYKIANLSKLQLKVYISGSQLTEFVLGQEVEVLVDKGEDDYYHLNGKINWISSKAEFTPKTIQTKEERVNLVYALKVSVKNNGMLKIGMPGEIKINPNQ
ncbi:MAG: HlyD family efflux transporter periplasmic adaptor subunit [Bacteroidetes bacterium]|nr:HlyD family efflux transporter periplasmic adaptor subunit [Bacteroidota bacterium]